MSGFKVIYMDPPWTFETYSEKGKGRSAEQHYDCMTDKRLSMMPVLDVAAPDCALLMWTTGPLLTRSLTVMEKLGFAYKGVAFTWVKTCRCSPQKWHMGCGYATRANAEFCLLGTVGKPKRVDKGVRSLVVAPVMEHSAKPPEVRERIERLYGDVPRLEMFARQLPDGWFSIGYDVDGRDIYNSLEFTRQMLVCVAGGAS